MQLKKWIQIMLVGTSILTLVGCHSARKNDDTAVNDANASYSERGAESSGLGEDSRFGDQAGGTRLSANKRVYYFDFDSNVVRPEDKPAISANANRLASNTRSKVMLEGHTDPRGSREYNIGLGERRAKAVAEIMTAKGVSSSQIRTVSYGAEKLAANGRSEADYQQDRRVVLDKVQ